MAQRQQATTYNGDSGRRSKVFNLTAFCTEAEFASSFLYLSSWDIRPWNQFRARWPGKRRKRLPRFPFRGLSAPFVRGDRHGAEVHAPAYGRVSRTLRRATRANEKPVCVRLSQESFGFPPNAKSLEAGQAGQFLLKRSSLHAHDPSHTSACRVTNDAFLIAESFIWSASQDVANV